MDTRVAPSPPSVDVRWEVVQRVAASASFHRSPRLRELLLYISERAIQNRPHELHEQQIGCGVFGRKPDYNPGEDNIVRVEIRQLRKRLEEYFATEGKDEPYVILIPKGAYVPIIEPREAASQLAVHEREASKAAPARWGSRPRWFWVQTAAILALSGACIWLWRENRSLAPHVAAAARPAGDRTPLWPLLFNENQETLIVCADSTLVVAESILHRSVSLDEYLAGDSGTPANLSGDVQELARSLAYSRRRWQFTDITDVRLVQRLSRLNMDHWDKVSVRSARMTQIQDFKNGNSILLGSKRSNLWNSLFEPMLNFRFEYDEQARTAFIRDRAAPPGKPEVYRAARPGESGESYSVIALVPNLRHTGSVLIIAGTTAESTEAAGEFIMNPGTSSTLLSSLMRRNQNRMPYFEVLLKSGTLEGVAKNAEIVADHILPDQVPST